jgi:hypothetical protein
VSVRSPGASVERRCGVVAGSVSVPFANEETGQEQAEMAMDDLRRLLPPAAMREALPDGSEVELAVDLDHDQPMAGVRLSPAALAKIAAYGRTLRMRATEFPEGALAVQQRRALGRRTRKRVPPRTPPR